MSYLRALGVSAVALAVLLAGSTASQASEASASSAQLPQSRDSLFGKRPAFASNQVIVRYDGNTSKSRIAAIRRSVGTRSTSPLISRMELLQLPSGTSVTRAVRALDALPGVSYAQPNHRRYPMAMPDDTDFGNLWGLNNTGQAVPDLFTGRPVTGTPDADIDAPEAWDIQTGSDTVKVAVLDTGVAWRHEDLVDNIWQNPGEVGLDGLGADKRTNGIDDDANGYKDDWHGWDFYDRDNNPDDDYLHGSHVAGTIGGTGNNATGVAGVAWDVTIVPLRFLGDEGGTEADAIKGYQYAAAAGVDIVNGSFGGGYSSRAERDAIAAAKDVLFVFASGNDGANNDRYASYPSNYAKSLPNVISVGATSFKDGRAFFSNYGATTVDLAAPGSRTYSTVLQKAVISDGFDEDTTGRWSTGGTRDRWEWTNLDRFYSSNSYEGSYLNNTDSWAGPTAPLDLTGLTSCELSFYTYYALERGRDFLKVETSIDAGGSWQQLGQLTGFNIQKVTYDLAPFNNVADLRVRFRLVTNSSVVDEGFHFTDFQLAHCEPSNWDYNYLDGTSMATPHVAGTAALLLSEHPGADPIWLRKMLNDGTDPVPGWAGKSKTGGRLNARGSLDAAALATDPVAFTVSSPASGGTTTDRTPTFSWKASGADSGIDEYQVYVDGVLASTVTDQSTTKTPGTTLAYGLHEWWVVAVDNDADTTESAHVSFYVKRLPTLRLYQGSGALKSCGRSLVRACTYRAGRTVNLTGFAGPSPEIVGSTVTLNFYKRSDSGGWKKEFTRNPPLNDLAGSVADIFTSASQARRGTWKVDVRVSPTAKTLGASGRSTYLRVR